MAVDEIATPRVGVSVVGPAAMVLTGERHKAVAVTRMLPILYPYFASIG